MAAKFVITLLVVLALASLTPAAHGSTVENAAAHETVLNGQGAAESWAETTKQKLAEGFGLDKYDAEVAAKETVKKAGDIATKTKEKVSDIASEATDKAGEEKDVIKGVIKDKAGEAKKVIKDHAPRSVAEAAEMAGEVKDKVMDKAADVKETMGASVSVEDASKAYEGVKQKAAEAFETAKDTMSHDAKETYEVAKEKLSEATGEKGAHMNREVDEL